MINLFIFAAEVQGALQECVVFLTPPVQISNIIYIRTSSHGQRWVQLLDQLSWAFLRIFQHVSIEKSNKDDKVDGWFIMRWTLFFSFLENIKWIANLKIVKDVNIYVISSQNALSCCNQFVFLYLNKHFVNHLYLLLMWMSHHIDKGSIFLLDAKIELVGHCALPGDHDTLSAMKEHKWAKIKG